MQNKKVYFLDLRTLIACLEDQSCVLTTTLRTSGKPASGSIVLKNGKITYCVLTLHNGNQTTGDEAYNLLKACTQWQVQWEMSERENQTSSHLPQVPLPSSPQAPASNNWYAPPALRQKKPLDPAFLQSLPVKDRLILCSVFTMIDGKRSTADIKAQLHADAEDIDQAIVGLHMLDLIE